MFTAEHEAIRNEVITKSLKKISSRLDNYENDGSATKETDFCLEMQTLRALICDLVQL